ncbi:ATP-binding cassette domain-containing protein [Polaromonas sp. P1(28)-13]|nr:ATP-binding cassette domain-containing protein [Polaromonas sp. P1(28)-13]
MNTPSRFTLEASGLTAHYGPVEALHSTDLHVDEGELVAVLGPNGAGKSTLLRRIVGLVEGKGTVTFDGSPLPRSDPRGCTMRGVVLVPEGRGIFGSMTVFENLDLGSYLATDKAEIKTRFDRVLISSRGSRTGKNSLAGRSPAVSNRCWQSGVA